MQFCSMYANHITTRHAYAQGHMKDTKDKHIQTRTQEQTQGPCWGMMTGG